jgi:hypothetical protein
MHRGAHAIELASASHPKNTAITLVELTGPPMATALRRPDSKGPKATAYLQIR